MSENKVFLAAIDRYTETTTVSNTEKKINGKDFISWGDNNAYPQFLWDLYNNCTTLQTIVNGTSDYVCGDDVVCNVNGFEKRINKKGETISDLISKIAVDYLIFGSFAIQIIRNFEGGISELYWIDINKLRSDEKNEVFFYSDDWNKSYGRVKYITYPKFRPNDINNASSIFYYKGHTTRSVYGIPMWSASVKNVQIDRAITDFHLNEINNNFMSSKMISFNNGTPDDELKTEIERNLNEKFTGTGNAGRILISFSESKEHAPEVVDLAADDFDKRYVELEKRNTEQLFISFRCTPLLVGMVTESNGFSTQEYNDSYKLFNKTTVKPIQNAIIDAFDKITGVKESITISPFTINFDNNEDKNVA
jgi:capsid portal protein